jgi:hypothetical protein
LPMGEVARSDQTRMKQQTGASRVLMADNELKTIYVIATTEPNNWSTSSAILSDWSHWVTYECWPDENG